MADDKESMLLPPPKKILEYLDGYVIGQELAKKRLSVGVYNHYKRLHHNSQFDYKPTKPRPVYSSDDESDYEDENSRTEPERMPGFKLWNMNSDTIKLEKSNIMMLGPTGTGKTLLVQTIAKCLNVPFVICDCTTLTESGYHGDDVETVIDQLLFRSDYNVERTQMGIIFLDEVDKICSAADAGEHKDVGGVAVQQALLKMLEGTIVTIFVRLGSCGRKKRFEIDTSNILFIASGAFTDLDTLIAERERTKDDNPGNISHNSNGTSTDGDPVKVETEDLIEFAMKNVVPTDLIEYGLIPEFVGRFPVLVPFRKLDADTLVRILVESKDSVVKQYTELLRMDKVALTFAPDALRSIAHSSMKLQTGARGLKSVLETILTDVMFDVPDSNITNVRITEACVNGLSTPEYDRDEATKVADSVNDGVINVPDSNVKNVRFTDACTKGASRPERDVDKMNKLSDSVRAFISFF